MTLTHLMVFFLKVIFAILLLVGTVIQAPFFRKDLNFSFYVD